MTFHDENEYLIHLLSCAIHGTAPEPAPASISLEKVFSIGAEHEVANIAYMAVQRLPEKPDPELMSRWREFYYNAMKRDVMQRRARDEILDALHAHGIPTLEVQGSVVKRYYPQSHWRMMSDLDIIIPADRLNEADGIMQSLGFSTENPKGVEVDAKRGNIAVELHTEFFASIDATRNALDQPFFHAVLAEDGTAVVSDTLFYLFHWLHTIKHCVHYGIGVRRIIDLYYLEIALRDEADQAYIDGVLKENGFYETKQKLLAVKEHWFGDGQPDPETAVLEQNIMDAGNHGNEDIAVRNRFDREQAEGKRFVRFKYFVAFLFPSKQAVYDRYPFCERHHYPIVLCWIHRFNCALFSAESWKKLGTVFTRLRGRKKY